MRDGYSGANIETIAVGEIEGLEPVTDNEARKIVSHLLRDNGTDLVPFGTEAGLFQSLGCSALVCGPG